jgi:hypothetical protein
VSSSVQGLARVVQYGFTRLRLSLGHSLRGVLQCEFVSLRFGQGITDCVGSSGHHFTGIPQCRFVKVHIGINKKQAMANYINYIT